LLDNRERIKMSSAELTTRFTNLPLRFPEKVMELVMRYTQTRRSHEDEERSGDLKPFERYIDLWWTALCLGVREGRRSPEAECGPWHKFIDTNQILPSDPWRAEHLMLLAVAETNSTEILEHPSQIIEIANEYAATGISLIADAMARENRPIWGATRLVEETIASGATQQSA
jgi:hypothetical protein